MSSRDSSFDAFAYYKGLTKQLSNKRNRFDLQKIPNNYNDVRKKQKIKLITKQQLIEKAFAKYKTNSVNNTAQQQTTQHQNQNQNQSQHHQQRNKIILKDNIIVQPKVIKHQKHEDTYINLPKSFFESFNGPNISLFKKPELPTSRVGSAVNNTKSLDKTFQSIFSASNFKPPQTSTPIEKTIFTPLISDPEEIYSELQSFRVTQKKPTENRFATFMNNVDKAAKIMDIKGFSDVDDPVNIIKYRIKEMIDDSRRHPNVDALNGSGSTVDTTTNKIPNSPDSLFLIPSTPRNNKDVLHLGQYLETPKMQMKQSQINPNFTAMLFETPAIHNSKFDLKPSYMNDSFLDSPLMSQIKFSPNNLFDSPATPSNDIFMDSPDFANNSMLLNTQNIFEDTADDMNWDDKNWLKDDDDLNFTKNTCALFSSPPKSVKKTRGISKNRNNNNYKPRHNQLQETFDRHTSLSSYQWTPHIKSQFTYNKATDQSVLMSPSIRYESKNIFESTFDLF
ncbi:unnamed protein product [Diamesa hyperborea]